MDSLLQNARLLIDPPGDGVWNMAVDEALMRSVGGELESPNSPPVLRFYQWSQPTLSLGYFQKHRARESHQSSMGCPMVRRNSGGGAIVHDQELTYSLTIPESHPLAGESPRLYELLHETLISVLSQMGAKAVLNNGLDVDLEKNFLCFQRRAPNDVILEEHKICGSAQRKKFHSISQHGSVILETSQNAPEIIGINAINGTQLSISKISDEWKRGLENRIGARFSDSKLSFIERK